MPLWMICGRPGWKKVLPCSFGFIFDVRHPGQVIELQHLPGYNYLIRKRNAKRKVPNEKLPKKGFKF